jgi:hypothetical protein
LIEYCFIKKVDKKIWLLDQKIFSPKEFDAYAILLFWWSHDQIPLHPKERPSWLKVGTRNIGDERTHRGVVLVIRAKLPYTNRSYF